MSNPLTHLSLAGCPSSRAAAVRPHLPPVGARRFRSRSNDRIDEGPIPHRHPDRVTLSKGITGMASANARWHCCRPCLPSGSGGSHSVTGNVQEAHDAIASTLLARLVATGNRRCSANTCADSAGAGLESSGARARPATSRTTAQLSATNPCPVLARGPGAGFFLATPYVQPCIRGSRPAQSGPTGIEQAAIKTERQGGRDRHHRLDEQTTSRSVPNIADTGGCWPAAAHLCHASSGVTPAGSGLAFRFGVWLRPFIENSPSQIFDDTIERSTALRTRQIEY